MFFSSLGHNCTIYKRMENCVFVSKGFEEKLEAE